MSNRLVEKNNRRVRRHKKIRAKIAGTETRPRLSVSKSNMAIFAQIIDDTKGVTLVSVSTSQCKGKTLRDRVVEAGKTIAQEANKKKITTVVFDRGGNRYLGNIKIFADQAREAGLSF